jgi:hypothetical protein
VSTLLLYRYIDERNAQVVRIREIYSQSLALTIWLGEDEMSNMGLNSWVENSSDNLRRCGTILEAHGRRTLEAALGIDVRAWESDITITSWRTSPSQAIS